MDVLLLIIIAVWISLVMAGAWSVQRATAASGWIDTIWSFAVGSGGVLAAIFADGALDRRIAAATVIVAWALRLGGHIGARTRSNGEDPRYAKLLDEWGDTAAWRLFLFLQIQALAAYVLVFAVYLAAANAAAFPRLVDLIAILVAILALVGEAASDAQLARFRKTPQARTEICETGFWRYSRHPNYFFEWLFWCCWPLLAMSASGLSWMSLLAPLLIYWLLVHVSGIPPLEEHMLRSRGEKFRTLQGRVNAFFPGPRKPSSHSQGDPQ
jgi:steroid 5-alpha reductase family enzyme